MQPRPLKFLGREPKSTNEQILKAEMLFYAIKNKEIDYVKEILAAPGDPSFIDFRFRDRHVNDYRAKQCYDIKHHELLSDNLPRSALTLACYYGLTEVVDLLIKKGANVNLASNPHTPLKYAICYRNKLGAQAAPLDAYREIVNLLVKNGATFDDTTRELDEDRLLPSKSISPPSHPNFLITRVVKVLSVDENIDTGVINKTTPSA